MEIPPGEPNLAAALEEHARRVRASGLLGRSGQIHRLFDYLVACAARAHVPKETEVAIDGFGREADFDASQDAMVRVYVHKLRRKLEDYYGQPGAAAQGLLAIPRGEYRLVLHPPPDGAAATGADAPEARDAAGAAPRPSEGGPPLRSRAPGPLSRRERWGAALLCALGLLCAVLLVERWRAPASEASTRVLRSNALWAPLLEDALPIQIVLGDYYIFGERDAGAGVARLIRDFRVNSRADLELRQKNEPELATRWADLRLGYLPTSTAHALRSVLPVLTGTDKPVTVTLASEFSAGSFKTSHVVYIGYLSGLGMLQDAVFANSRFAIGGSYDELIDAASGTSYVSEAGEPLPPTQRYRDYAYLSTFRGPDGNQHLILAGTRDTAVMQMAEIAASVRRSGELLSQAGGARDYEALYEVYGVDGTNLEARLVTQSPLDSRAIWSEAPPEAAGENLAQAPR